MRLTSELVARFPRPGTVVPGKPAFRPDGKALTYLWSPKGDMARELWEMDLETGTRRALATGAAEESYSREEQLRRERQRLRETGVTHYHWAAEANHLLVSMRGDAYVDGRLVAERATDPGLSRNGALLVYVRDGELWSADVSGSTHNRRLTDDAQDGVTNGLAGYLAQEEMQRSSGFWISRDGAFVAFEQVDERQLPVYPIVHQGADRIEIEEHRYPFAGAANPGVRLGVVPSAGGAVTWMDLEGAEYLARVAWHPDGRLFIQTQTRDQRRLQLRAYDVRSGQGRLLVTEESRSWINLHHDLRFLETGEYVWASERNGLKQLYLYREDVALRALTNLPWPVDAVVGMSKTHVTFAGSGGNPVERHVYSAPLAGGEAVRLTKESGWHDAVFSRDGSRWVDLAESRNRPPSVAVYSADGAAIREVHPPAQGIDLPAPKLLTFSSRDGETLHAALYRPGKTPAPLIVCVYGGPHVQAVQDNWAATVDLRAQHLAQRGFLVLKVDNRGSARRGLAFESAIHRRMGEVEVRDQVDGVNHLRAKGLVDGDRVGLYGWSYGGYMTLMCLCRAPEVFKAGVAGAPVTHWDGYDTYYTERYMGTPQENPEGYRESAVMKHVGRLNGKLMLIHGMMDENVHFRHTARLIRSLVDAGKPYELLMYPEERHMPRSEKARAAMEERVAEFFEENL